MGRPLAPSAAQLFKTVDHLLLEGIEGIGITQINALTGSVLGELLEMESTFTMGQKLHG